MHATTSKSLLVASALLLVSAAPSTALAGELNFRANASGAQERVGDPPAEVDPSGAARGKFRFAKDLSSLDVRVRVRDLVGETTVTHIHCGIAGQNGPIIVDLDPVIGVQDGVIVDDTFTNADIKPTLDPEDPVCEAQCGFEINNIASLRAGADASCLYLNVHSTASPAGEVRGQLLPFERRDRDEDN